MNAISPQVPQQLLLFLLVVAVLVVGESIAPAVTSAAASVNVLTQHNDNARTGANLNETALTTANVNRDHFGKLYAHEVDGSMYAQPLYVSNLTFPAGKTRNVLYLATMHNTVYAFDADDPNTSTALLWSRALGGAVSLPDANIGAACGTYRDIAGEIGILSTPVIDLHSKTIYVVRFTRMGWAGSRISIYRRYLHALDLLTGAEKGRVQITAPGFNPRMHNQRAGLLLLNDVIYIGFSAFCDTRPYSGWLLGYDATTLRRKYVFDVTPTGERGGLWQAGQGPAADDKGDIYVISGNGDYEPMNPPDLQGKNLGNSFIKLRPNGATLEVVTRFTPYNAAELNDDLDLGSAGALLIPGTNVLVGGGKEGKLYVLDRDDFGGFTAGGPDNVVQSFPVTSIDGGHHLHGSPIYWDSPSGPLIYVWGEKDYLKAFALDTSQHPPRFNTTPLKGPRAPLCGDSDPPIQMKRACMPGGILSLSANGRTPGTGILWANIPINENTNQKIVKGVLRAFNAMTLQELWNSEQNATRDSFGYFAKFSPPTVANGRVYLATFQETISKTKAGLVVYGLLPSTPRLTQSSPSSVYGQSATSTVIAHPYVPTAW